MKKSILTKVLLTTVSFIILFSTAITSSADGCLHWYIKRRVGVPPVFPKEADIIDNLGAFYLDKSAAQNGEKRLYITFDAGYENGNVEKILDILKAENVSASFFLLDNIILKNTDLVIRMADEGHLVCNHTRNHKNLSFANKEEIYKNILSLEDIYREKTGREIAKYFRFPEGAYSLDAIKCVNEMGYKTVFWSFAYDDWDNSRQPDKEAAIKKVLDGTHNGAIMLFHPTSNTNAEIFQTLISEWKKMGYSFSTLDSLK